MISGTYKIQNYIGKNTLETNYISLTEDADGVLKGLFGELFYRESVPFSGMIQADGNFSVTTGNAITIVKDIKLDIQGKLEGEDIKGTLIFGAFKMPFFGKKVAEAMNAAELIAFRKEENK